MKKIWATLVASSALTAGVAITSTLTAAPAQAFQVSLDPQYGSTENTGASTLLNFTFSEFNGGVRLDIGIKNTTDGTKGVGATAATLTGVAFAYLGPDLGNDVNIYSYDPGSSNFTKTWVKPFDTPSLTPYGDFDYAFSLQRNTFENGNPNGGLKAGEFTTVSAFIDTGLTPSFLEGALEEGFKNKALNVAGRFQQVTGGEVNGEGSDTVLGKLVTEKPVPEPTTTAASVLALGGLGFLKKKFQQKPAN